MIIILDTNVFVFGVFFTGPSHQILKAWHGGKIVLVISTEILEKSHHAHLLITISPDKIKFVKLLSQIFYSIKISIFVKSYI